MDDGLVDILLLWKKKWWILPSEVYSTNTSCM